MPLPLAFDIASVFLVLSAHHCGCQFLCFLFVCNIVSMLLFVFFGCGSSFAVIVVICGIVFVTSSLPLLIAGLIVVLKKMCLFWMLV